jgi:hypothetical protein
MNSLSNLFGREPAMVLGFIQAAIVLVMAFGLKLSTEQVGAITAFAAVTLALVTRQSVVPVATVQDAGLNPNNLDEPRQV